MSLPTANILNLPFRRTNDVSISAAIKQYISTKYDQHPNMFIEDLTQIDELRKNAVTVQEPHSSGIRRIQQYAAQLVFMGAKFPIDLGADFSWYPALGYPLDTPMIQNNVRFELANVLFNLGVLYCQLAVTSNRSTSEGLKSGSNYFCLAAGVMAHLKDKIVPDMRSTAPHDMEPLTLESLEQLMLAQAQECFWQKAVKDGFKDASIAKLAAKVSDLYLLAYQCASKSTTISSEWIHHMHAKHNHFAGAAQYRAACDCLEKGKYGEEVARLRDSLVCANNALAEKRYINKIVQADVEGLRNKVQEDLKRAEKDNDIIYLLPVPPKSEMKILERASMVSSKIPKEIAEPLSMLGEQADLGRPLFSKLVPYSVHMAASIYASRRDATINTIISDYELLTGRVHSLLQSLNLPGSLQALEKPLGLPPGITSHAEEIRQQNGPDRLRRAVADVDRLKATDRAAYDEGVALLRGEATEDGSARRKYGTDQWSRLSSEQAAPRLYSQIKEIDGYLLASEDSDATVRIKFADNQDLIQLLNSSDRALEEFVPSSRRATITPAVQTEVTRLRNALNDATRLELKRRRRVDSLRSKAQADDVNPELLRETARLERELPMQAVSAAQFEDFFDKRLMRYDTDRDAIDGDRREQDTILNRIAEANTSFATARRGDTSTRERERALQKLENAYFAYKEIVQNLDVGRKFYNDLATLVGKFRDECRNFAYQRRAEAAQIQADIANSLPIANLNIAPPQQQQHQPPHQHQQPIHQPLLANQSRRHQPPRAYTNAPQRATPLPAPIPVKPASAAPVANMVPSDTPIQSTQPSTSTWGPEMGIKFANVSTPHGAPQQKNRAWDPSMGVRFNG